MKTRKQGRRIGTRRVLLLLSGGLDSTTLLALLVAQGYEVTSMFFDYGQPTASLERARAKANAAKYRSSLFVEQKLPLYSTNTQQQYYPGRNLALVAAAASYAERERLAKIFLGLVTSTSTPWAVPEYPDCTEEFVSSLNSVLQHSAGTYLSVEAPLIDVPKPGIFSLARRLGVDPNDTISCLRNQGCGECVACIEREFAQKA